VPDGADTVVRVEDTDRGHETVAIADARDAMGTSPLQRNVRPRGEDVRAGSVVLTAGRAIGPAQLGVLASVGAAAVDVVRRPRVAFVSSGDELVDVGDFAAVERGAAIVSSNSYTIPAMARRAGALCTDHGVARDTLDAVRATLAAALADTPDLLVTSGGISVGEHDHTRAALEAFGLEQRFWRARIRPGGPVGFGHVRTADGRVVPWLGLPGNPVSAMVTFTLFGLPLLRRLSGHAHVASATIAVRLAHDVAVTPTLAHFLRAVVTLGADGVPSARLTGAQGSNLLTSMALANALLVVPESSGGAAAGAMLQALPLEWPWPASDAPA
jgi:molybdopterin molybdotransferase